MAKYLKRDKKVVVYKSQKVKIDPRTKNTYILGADGKTKVVVEVPKTPAKETL